MNTSELVDKITDGRQITKADARSLVEAALTTIVEAVNAGEEVSLGGFGKFTLKKSSERQGRNPATGVAMTIAAQRKLAFTPAKAVRERLNG